MKKLFVLIMIACCFSVSLTAQRAQEEMITIDKQNLPGFSITFPDMSVEAVEAALIQKMEKQIGLKSSKFSGFVAYLNQPVPEFGTLNYDIYTKVSEIGKKGNKATVLYLFVAKGNLIPVTSVAEPEVFNNIIKFLDDFVLFAKINDTQNQVITFNKQLEKMEKEQKSLISEKKKLQGELEDVSKKIDENDATIKRIKTDIENTQNQLKLLGK